MDAGNEARKAADTERRAKFNVLARVKRGVTMAAASAELDVLARQLAAMHPKDDDYPKKFTTRMITANEYLLGESGVGASF